MLLPHFNINGELNRQSRISVISITEQSRQLLKAVQRAMQNATEPPSNPCALRAHGLTPLAKEGAQQLARIVRKNPLLHLHLVVELGMVQDR